MTIFTISSQMTSNQRKTALLVHLCCIGYNPGIRGMAPVAIRTDRLLMNIKVA
jgi:hypothetical protein